MILLISHVMSSQPEDITAPPSPDEAFTVLGNETRLSMLHVLGEASGDMSFSVLRERVGMRDSGQFNYHLNQLVGHFVEQTDEGYELRQPGKRVIQAVLSGAVTEEPVIEPTPIDHGCPYCGATGEASYSQGRVELYCTECPGLYEKNERAPNEVAEKGHIGGLSLPPAGLRDQCTNEIVATASKWCHLELIALSMTSAPAVRRYSHTRSISVRRTIRRMYRVTSAEIVTRSISRVGVRIASTR